MAMRVVTSPKNPSKVTAAYCQLATYYSTYQWLDFVSRHDLFFNDILTSCKVLGEENENDSKSDLCRIIIACRYPHQSFQSSLILLDQTSGKTDQTDAKSDDTQRHPLIDVKMSS